MQELLKYIWICFLIKFSLIFLCKRFSIRGSISNNGALILCGTHFNCFLDGIFITSISQRMVFMIVSSHSYRQKIAGLFMRLVSSIPINRPMDSRFAGKGLITVSNHKVSGQNTAFLSEVRVNDYVTINGKELRVTQVLSDNELQVEDDHEQTNPTQFSVYPKVDNAECMQATLKRLKAGDAISIYPEGETHEQPAMLPLKAGIANIVLSAMAQGVNPEVQCYSYIISAPGKFRSKYELIIGKPWKFDPDLASIDRKQAYQVILNKVKEELEKLMLPAQTFEEIELAMFIAKVKKVEDFEMNKWEVLKEILGKMKGMDEELFEQMRKIKEKARVLGVSKYQWREIERFELWMNVVLGTGLVILFGVGILILLVIAAALNFAVKLHKEEVLKKLPYRKTAVDCLNTWRISYIGAILAVCSIFQFVFCLVSTLSVCMAIFSTVVMVMYFVWASFALEMILHAKQIIVSFRSRGSEEVKKLNSLRAAFIEDARTKLKC